MPLAPPRRPTRHPYRRTTKGQGSGPVGWSTHGGTRLQPERSDIGPSYVSERARARLCPSVLTNQPSIRVSHSRRPRSLARPTGPSTPSSATPVQCPLHLSAAPALRVSRVLPVLPFPPLLRRIRCLTCRKPGRPSSDLGDDNWVPMAPFPRPSSRE